MFVSGGENDGVDLERAREIGEDDVVARERSNARLHHHFPAHDGRIQAVVDHLLAWYRGGRKAMGEESMKHDGHECAPLSPSIQLATITNYQFSGRSGSS